MTVEWLRFLFRMENQVQLPGAPDIYVFGVKHSDFTLVDSIPDILPADVSAVSHERTRQEMALVREAFSTSSFRHRISLLKCSPEL